MQLVNVTPHKEFKRVGSAVKVILQELFVGWRHHHVYCIFTTAQLRSSANGVIQSEVNRTDCGESNETADSS